MLLFFSAVFCSCLNDSDDINTDPLEYRLATVENPNGLSKFIFVLDKNDTKMWTARTHFPDYTPETGQRIIAGYLIQDKKGEDYNYDYDVELGYVYQVLTKDIFNIMPETQDSIGNDPVKVTDMWIANKYMNVEFIYNGYNQVHFINMVYDESKTYDDGKIHLEFRHNEHNDPYVYSDWGLASFDLHSLRKITPDNTVDIVVHVKQYDSKEEKLWNFTFDFDDATDSQKSISIPAKTGVFE